MKKLFYCDLWNRYKCTKCSVTKIRWKHIIWGNQIIELYTFHYAVFKRTILNESIRDNMSVRELHLVRNSQLWTGNCVNSERHTTISRDISRM